MNTLVFKKKTPHYLIDTKNYTGCSFPSEIWQLLKKCEGIMVTESYLTGELREEFAEPKEIINHLVKKGVLNEQVSLFSLSEWEKFSELEETSPSPLMDERNAITVEEVVFPNMSSNEPQVPIECNIG